MKGSVNPNLVNLYFRPFLELCINPESHSPDCSVSDDSDLQSGLLELTHYSKTV